MTNGRLGSRLRHRLPGGALTACNGPWLSHPNGSGLATFTLDDWSFEYPAAWHFESIHYFQSFYNPVGYLGSTSVDTNHICNGTPSSQSCSPRNYDLPPDDVVITIGVGAWIMNDPAQFFEEPTDWTSVTVAGMPSILREKQLASDRLLLTWMIPIPRISMDWVQLDADMRGPDGAVLRTQVEDLVASFRFAGGPAPLPTTGLE